ncbi:hypothetical protein EVAR_103160_1 [Eumeta japonica]|uniref:Uncharacterized protein n=1 Tax=Eumeta variegata TaxID=151549 RepID=A0A4C1YG18_EUMVA|nr:hypothetical protein EVAR_103160_1 [Eumeta japonica]
MCPFRNCIPKINRYIRLSYEKGGLTSDPLRSPYVSPRAAYSAAVVINLFKSGSVSLRFNREQRSARFIRFLTELAWDPSVELFCQWIKTVLWSKYQSDNSISRRNGSAKSSPERDPDDPKP